MNKKKLCFFSGRIKNIQEDHFAIAYEGPPLTTNHQGVMHVNFLFIGTESRNCLVSTGLIMDK